MKPQKAEYRKESIEEFRNNPLTEALPPRQSPRNAVKCLMVRPPYSKEDRNAPVEDRLAFTQRIARIHQPLEMEMDVFQRIDRCIRWSYADRNPLDPSHVEKFIDGRNRGGDGSMNYTGKRHPHTYGFSILGVSGLGKSSSVETILNYYPQVIRHSSYRGIPFEATQIVWMKLDCPSDGRPKALCLSCFKMLDKLVGTNYYNQYSRSTLDAMLTTMSSLCDAYHIGVLLIDEIQHLCMAKSGVSASVLNFLVSIVNQTGIPVITIGTPKALAILQDDFQQAKRGSGQGDSLWERMKEDESWKLFCRALWPYQYTAKKIPFTAKMSSALYEEALGIPFLAVHIYKLAQEEAILSGRESFQAGDFRDIARKKMGLTAPMRAAIRSGKDLDLMKYMDITPFSAADYLDNYSVAAEAQSPVKGPEKKAIPVIDQATAVLTGLGLSYSEAKKYVLIAAARHPESNKCSTIAVDAYELYQKQGAPASETGGGGSLASLTGYNDAKDAGLIDES